MSATKPAISKEQWAAIAKELQSMMPYVHFSYEGYSIQIVRARLSECKTAIRVYINGRTRREWLCDDGDDSFNPIVKQLWRKRQKAVYTPSEIKKIEKAFGKRNAKRAHPNLHKKIDWYCPDFTTANTLVSQYKKLGGLVLERIGASDTMITREGDSINVDILTPK